MREEIFTLGCTMYTILGGQEPFLDVSDFDADEIEARWSSGEYPDTSKLLWGDLIRKCWTGEIKSAPELLLLTYQSLLDFTKERFAYRSTALLGECDTIGRTRSSTTDQSINPIVKTALRAS
jgi:hypothetical protein